MTLRRFSPFVIAAFSLSCNAVQDALPGGICAYVEPLREYSNCTYVLETVLAVDERDQYAESGEYNEWGLLTSQQFNGVESYWAEYDERARNTAWRNDGGEATATWDGCSAFEASFDTDFDGTVDAVRSYEMRRGRVESSVTSWTSGQPFRVSELQTEWTGKYRDLAVYTNDGAVSSRIEHEHSDEDGLHREVKRSLDGDGALVTREVLFTDGTLEPNRNERVVAYQEYDSTDTLVFAEQLQVGDLSQTHSFDLNGNGEWDIVDLNDLDSEGRLIRRRREYTNFERSSEIVLTWTCE